MEHQGRLDRDPEPVYRDPAQRDQGQLFTPPAPTKPELPGQQSLI